MDESPKQKRTKKPSLVYGESLTVNDDDGG